MVENGYLASGAIVVRAIRDIEVNEELLAQYNMAEEVF
jgi:SET domain-containing protein